MVVVVVDYDDHQLSLLATMPAANPITASLLVLGVGAAAPQSVGGFCCSAAARYLLLFCASVFSPLTQSGVGADSNALRCCRRRIDARRRQPKVGPVVVSGARR